MTQFFHLYFVHTHNISYNSKGKGTDTALCGGISPLREITCHMGSHSVKLRSGSSDFPSLPHPKLVLDLVTPEGYKAELTWVVVISQDSLLAKDGHLS